MLVTPAPIVTLVKTSAFREGVIPDAGNASANRDTRQASAFSDGGIFNPMLVTVLPSIVAGMVNAPDASLS